jgi:hypothetical protein
MARMTKLLSPQEDVDLRRLHVLGRFGLLQGETADYYDALRDRDRRNDVRDPISIVVPLPSEGSNGIVRQWGD